MSRKPYIPQTVSRCISASVVVVTTRTSQKEFIEPPSTVVVRPTKVSCNLLTTLIYASWQGTAMFSWR